MKLRKQKKTIFPTRAQIEQVIFRSMKIEHSGMTRFIAKKAAARVRLEK